MSWLFVHDWPPPWAFQPALQASSPERGSISRHSKARVAHAPVYILEVLVVLEKGQSMLGRFEEAILMALIHVKGQATIGDLYEALAKHKMRRSFGAIYTALGRMLAKKFVTRRKGEPLPERGGKARYQYRITSGGRAAIAEAQKVRAAWGKAAATHRL